MVPGFQRGAFQPHPAYQQHEAEGFQCTAFQLDAFQNICATPPVVVVRPTGGGTSRRRRLVSWRRHAVQVETLLKHKQTGQEAEFVPAQPPPPLITTPYEIGLLDEAPIRIFTSQLELVQLLQAEAAARKAQWKERERRRKRNLAIVMMMFAQEMDDDDDE